MTTINQVVLAHPDGGNATIASSNINLFTGKLINIKGSPSDGYSADIANGNDILVGRAFNHMDGHGWDCGFRKNDLP